MCLIGANKLAGDWRVCGVDKLSQQDFGFLANRIYRVRLWHAVTGQNAVSQQDQRGRMNGHDAGDLIQLVERRAFQAPFERAQVGPARDKSEVLLSQVSAFSDRFDGDSQGVV